MNGKPDTSAEATELRHRAEARLGKQQHKKKAAQPRTEADTQRLLHELQVHQIELEMQNAELQDTRDEVEAGLEQYADLYDFAPVGYFSVDEQGLILKVNLTGAALLGVERSRLVKRRLARFVTPMSRPVFLAFLQGVLAGPGRQVCEAELLKEDGTHFWADLQAESIASPSGTQKGCRLAVSDITGLKRAEKAQHRMEALAAVNRELTAEIKQRQVVEKALRKSEQQSSQLLAESLQLQKQLHTLSGRIVDAQEDERKRISRELHDEIGQILTGISLHLGALAHQDAADAKDFKKKIVQMQQLVEKSVNIVHEFAGQLRPAVLDDLGLIPALYSYVKDFAERTGLSICVTGFARGKTSHLDSAKRTVLYRVAQEALLNVARHAQASQVNVSIQKLRGVIRMEVKDNGKSFHVQGVLLTGRNRHLGLLGMRERVEMVGGRFTVESSPGKGTTVRAEIPFANGTRD